MDEIYYLRDCLKNFENWEDMLKDQDRDAWKEFQHLVNDLTESIERAESELESYVSEAREYVNRCEMLEDELYAEREIIDDLRDTFRRIKNTVDEESK